MIFASSGPPEVNIGSFLGGRDGFLGGIEAILDRLEAEFGRLGAILGRLGRILASGARICGIFRGIVASGARTQRPDERATVRREGGVP